MIDVWYISVENSFGMCQEIPFATEDDAIKALPFIKKDFPEDEFTVELFNGMLQMPMTFEDFIANQQ